MQREAAESQLGALPGSGEGGAREIGVVGAHGGAGVTTLAFWLRPAWDIGLVRRLGQSISSSQAVGELPLVLVARNTLVAAVRARGAIETIAWRRGRPTILAVVSDGLPEPMQATRSFDVLARRVVAIVRVPFVPALRIAVNPALVVLPSAASDAIAEIRAAAEIAVTAKSGTSVRSRGR